MTRSWRLWRRTVGRQSPDPREPHKRPGVVGRRAAMFKAISETAAISPAFSTAEPPTTPPRSPQTPAHLAAFEKSAFGARLAETASHTAHASAP